MANVTPSGGKTEDVQVQVAAPSLESVLSLEAGVDALLSTIADNQPALPALHVEWERLSFSVQLPRHPDKVETVGSTLMSMGAFASKPGRQHNVLASVKGRLRPGTTTLLLAPSGAGKSTLLKALAGRIPEHKMGGHVWLGGRPIHDVNAKRLAGYVGQTDVHMPLLTVKETFDFAWRSWNGSDPPGVNAAMNKVEAQKVAITLKLLGLDHCADTVVGNALVRGVSGGEKKRVTLGEMLMANYRFLAMDEISTGLDAAATLDIVRNITKAARVFRATYIISLLQPAPEVVELFDEVMLMREGQIVYHGPTNALVPYFEGMGIHFFNDQAVADFIVDFLADPHAIYARQVQRLEEDGLPLPNNVPPLATDELVLYFKAHARRHKWNMLGAPEDDVQAGAGGAAGAGAGGLQSVDGDAETKADETKVDETRPVPAAAPRTASMLSRPEEYEFRLSNPYAESIYGKDVRHANQSWFEMARLLLARQWKVQTRNSAFVGPRVGQAIFMGLLLGAIFWQLNANDFQLRVGLLFFGCIILSFSNISELPFASEARNVVYKQSDGSFYSTSAYLAGVMLTHLPVATLEAAIFGSIMYWMTGFASDAGRFIIFLVLVWLLSLVASNLFRLYAFLAPNEDTAQTLVGPSVGISLIFAGFMVTKDNMPSVFLVIYWISPFSWLLRALMINEFGDSAYDFVPAGATKRFGDLVLDTVQMQNGDGWIIACIIYFIGLYLLFAVAGVLALNNIRHEPHVGTAHANKDLLIAPIVRKRRMAQNRGASWMKTPTSANLKMAFTPMTVAFRDLHYSVPVKVDGNVVQRELLAGISGCARPGTMTALMGASGAGKSTLMDVICGRKTGGTRTGDILVNGHKVDQRAFARVMGYVEQADLITTYATVRETLQFSAALRLSRDVPTSARLQFVEDVLALLELDKIANQIVGDDTAASSISPGERKRLNIGIELVANPTVLFLDEPTSGLDSRAAMSVMRAIKRVALTGRTVVATIHQPSAEIFHKFDQLLLLQKGGHVTYFGPVNGNDGMVPYLESVPGTPKLPARTNPADWMLQVTGSGVSLDTGVEKGTFVNAWKASAKCREAKADIDSASAPAAGSQPLTFKRKFERSIFEQIPVVVSRQVTAAWRNIPLNLTRFLILTFLGVMFGLVFFDMNVNDLAGVQSTNGFLFVGPTFCSVIFMLTSVPFVARERAVFYRERLSNTYAAYTYALALFVAELPFCIAYSTVYCCITYWMVGLPDDGGVFLHYLLVSIVLSINFASMGQVLVAVVPNKDVAQMLTGTVISVCNLLGGFFLPLPDMAIGVKWVFWSNPSSYSYHVIASLVFHCDGASDVNTTCPKIDVVASSGVTSQTVSQYTADLLGYEYDDRWLMTIGALSWMVGLHILCALALTFISHLKR